ncbi:MAG: hypothetical protein ALECFALPRED_006525 [Alectoria fallacina]|uniref:Bulb-type lectin domain-containing protein n=1 Tax=Alectoria fallacina TaxID=1903189 RepID=A0A8H3G331_9LECA|nr:MAG: hypothetical protein ALECFALPRED_006525 [Alectoria fallacina]
MLAKTLCLLLPMGLALASPVTKLAKRYPYATWTAGQYWDIQAAGPPFVGLDNGIGFYFQTDGNFVVYHGSSIAPNAVWNSDTAGHDCQNANCELTFQGDGNFVIYVNGGAVWNTGTAGAGHRLEFRNVEPYITIYNSDDRAIYSTPGPPVGGPGGGGGGGGGEDPCDSVPCVVCESDCDDQGDPSPE